MRIGIAATAVVCLLLSGGLTAPASPGGKTSEESAPILVGVSNAQSGPSSSLGRELVAGSKAYFEVVNREGGIYGRRIQIIVEDDGYEPDPAVQNTFDLIKRRQAFFLFDYVGTPTLTRVLPLLLYYEQTGIVNVAPFTGADPQRKPPYDKFVFNIRASYREETRRLVDYLAGKGYRRIGFLEQADSYGKSGEIGVVEALAAHRMNIAAITAYRRNQAFEPSMREQVRILREGGADAVIAVGAYAPCAAFIRDARLGGWDVPVATVSFVGAQSMLKLLIDASQAAGRDLTKGLVSSQVVPLPSQKQYPLVARFQQYVDRNNWGSVPLEGWLNAVVAVEALRRTGPHPTRPGFTHAMESLGHWDPGIGSGLEFSSTSHQGLHRVWLVETRNREWAPAEGLP